MEKTMKTVRGCVIVSLMSALVIVPTMGAEQHMMQPRVPADKLAEARALTSPFPDSPEMLAKGKALYEGKGTCVNCHGQSGGGDGPVAAPLNPSPRSFHHHGFWRHRTEGEIFWVIKHGSPGTSMIGFGDQLTDEEIWAIIQYERSFAGEHAPGAMGHGRGRGPMRESGGMGPGGEGCCSDR
jgi:mono/diheme cytochrome c family protein